MSLLGVRVPRIQIGNNNWQQFGANKSDASSECPNIQVPMFGVQTEFYLCHR